MKNPLHACLEKLFNLEKQGHPDAIAFFKKNPTAKQWCEDQAFAKAGAK